MPSKQEITCKCGCGRKKLVRTADVKRGWGKYYSKSCKAHNQAYNKKVIYGDRGDFDADDSIHPFSSEGLGQDGYGF